MSIQEQIEQLKYLQRQLPFITHLKTEHDQLFLDDEMQQIIRQSLDSLLQTRIHSLLKSKVY